MNNLNLQCVRQGREAFRTYGVTGKVRHSFALGSLERASFLAGFTAEHNAARERAGDEALAYHQLSVRDNSSDRAWAEQLAAKAA
jgi:hypothetical protein